MRYSDHTWDCGKQTATLLDAQKRLVGVLYLFIDQAEENNEKRQQGARSEGDKQGRA
jgi:hypothetical protein